MKRDAISINAGPGRAVVPRPNRRVNPPSKHRRRAGTVRRLTDRQIEVLDCVRAYVREHGVAPSRPEIAAAIGIRNSSTVDGHLTALMKKGWIELRPGSPRNIRLLKDDLPLTIVGPIAAGEPILADERSPGPDPERGRGHVLSSEARLLPPSRRRLVEPPGARQRERRRNQGAAGRRERRRRCRAPRGPE